MGNDATDMSCFRRCSDLHVCECAQSHFGSRSSKEFDKSILLAPLDSLRSLTHALMATHNPSLNQRARAPRGTLRRAWNSRAVGREAHSGDARQMAWNRSDRRTRGFSHAGPLCCEIVLGRKTTPSADTLFRNLMWVPGCATRPLILHSGAPSFPDVD